MSEPKYSDFTLNFNPGARGNDKAPTLKGKSKVIDSDGSATEFDVAAWGPNKAQSGGTGLLQRHLHAERSHTPRAS